MTPQNTPSPSRASAVSDHAPASPWPPTVCEWLAGMQRTDVNGLLIAPTPVTDTVLGSLKAGLSQPLLERWHDGTPWDGHEHLHTLVLHDVFALSPRDQCSLFTWMNGHGQRCRIVALACLPVFPLVEDGAFLAPLYYRLNLLYAEVEADSFASL